IEKLSPTIVRPKHPIKPKNIPQVCFEVTFLEKNKIPNIKVNKGVNAFNMPDRAEGKYLPAMENNMDGIKLPDNPAAAK
ncbi:MAG: hypothetical protein RIR51_2007, partial [Bacteroidota bacterium]